MAQPSARNIRVVPTLNRGLSNLDFQTRTRRTGYLSRRRTPDLTTAAPPRTERPRAIAARASKDGPPVLGRGLSEIVSSMTWLCSPVERSAAARALAGNANSDTADNVKTAARIAKDIVGRVTSPNRVLPSMNPMSPHPFRDPVTYRWLHSAMYPRRSTIAGPDTHHSRSPRAECILHYLITWYHARVAACSRIPSGDAGEYMRLVAAGARREVGPTFEPEGLHGGRDLRGGGEESLAGGAG